MSKFDPSIHHRRSIRLKGYDYSQAGLYFVTVCVQDCKCIFGNVVDGKMVLNDAGQIAHNEWLKTAELRKNVKLHNFIVMPNHFHTIFEITHPVGAYCIRPDETTHQIPNVNCIRPDEIHHDGAKMDNRIDVIPDKPMGVMPDNQMGVIPDNQMGVCNTPLRSPSQTVGAIIRGYKSAVTRQINAFGVPFKWQRDMHEHIIRDYGSYARIDDYILTNPIKWESDRFYNIL